MKTKNITIFVGLIFLFAGANGDLRSIVKPFVYKFGNDYGNVVQVLEGTILPLVFQTYKNIQVPDGMVVTYIEVHVYSVSSPKVDYDSNSQQVSISFSFTQMTMSHYKIIVKAVPSTNVIF